MSAVFIYYKYKYKLCYNNTNKGGIFMKIGIASDHRGYKLKELIKEEYKNPNVKFIDYGTDTEEITDYPDYAFILGEKVVSKEVDFGVAICGSGIGIGIACNKVKGIRCATVKTVEDVKMTRNDNNANVIAFSEKTDLAVALKLIETMINTPFSGIDRYVRRINKIRNYEENN